MTKPFTTPPLPYDFDALEPYIDKETMMIHHDKHHVAYTTKLNAALEKYPELFKKTPEELLQNLSAIPEDIRMAVRNNGGGHVNHTLFWESMTPNASGQPKDMIAQMIKKSFEGFENFKKQFEEAAATQFGSGWAWLTVEGDALRIEKTSNQDSPLSEKRIPLLALDVWEHAYYLKYKNVRPDYITAFWNVINWENVNKKLKKVPS